ncbi:MAG: aminoacyl-histidine dipeptidase, partial [Firmicutes bacterium]|nr:aminoacyl-histidine dipeptidase [Bacillota bacterium]
MEFDLSKRYCYYFNELSKIPRGSRNEKAASDWVVEFAKAHGLKYTQDEVWNVVVDKPASPGYEDKPPIILQGHLDMVCEKNNDVEHDFEKDPLDLYVDEEGWLHARGTTLGADDG